MSGRWMLLRMKLIPDKDGPHSAVQGIATF